MQQSIGASIAAAQKFYRFGDWFHFLGFTFLGILFGARSSDLDFLLVTEAMIASSLLLAFAYSFNVLYDSEVESSMLPSHNATTPGRLRGLLLSLAPAAVGLALVVRSSEAFFMGLLFVVLWGLYSGPVLRLKAVPLLCTISNGVGFSLLFLIGLAMVATFSTSSILFFSLLVLLEIPAQLIHEVAHSQGDKLLGVNTSAVQYGDKRSLEGAVLSLAGAIVLAVVMSMQGIVNVLTALSAGSFSSIFLLLFLLERQSPALAAGSSEESLAKRFRSLRAQYRCGGILAGSIFAVGLLL